MDILMVLMQRPGEVVSKTELMQTVWGDAFVEESNLSQSIFVLRKALGERASENRYVATIPGRGYRFVAKIEQTTDDGDSNPTPIIRSEDSQDAPFRRTYFGIHKKWAIATFLTATVMLGAVALLPRIARSLNNRGIQHQQKGEIVAAIEDYSWALRLNPGNAALHYDLADAYEDIPDYDKAITQYQSAIDADPSFYPAYNNLSRLYILRRGDSGAALRLLDRAMNMQPPEVSVKYTIYKNYGWANLELAELSEAEGHLKLALQLEPQRGSAHCLIAKVLKRQGRDIEAAPEWEMCLAYSGQAEVEPEWRSEAQENLRPRLADSGSGPQRSTSESLKLRAPQR